MATTAAARDALYARLQHVLGDKEAQTMREMLGAEGMADLATKADIRLLDDRVSGLDDKVSALDDKVSALDDKVNGLDRRMIRLEARMDGLDQRLDGFDQRMGRFEDYMDKFDGRVHGFHEALREQTRTFVIASSTSTLLVAGVAFAAARLVT